MIKINNVAVHGWEAGIRGMRNPMNSWDKSDTEYKLILDSMCSEDVKKAKMCGGTLVEIGENDLNLMQSLVKAGSDHSKFMRMITVTVDITAPLYWWKEFDTYKVGTVRNSCSTMHKVTEKEFTLDDFSCEHLLSCSIDGLIVIINYLNDARDIYLNFDNKMARGGLIPEIRCKKDMWWQIIQLLPSSYNQTATVQLNYAVLRNMYHSRKNHKLDEWVEFCKWVETLPYAKELICYE